MIEVQVNVLGSVALGKCLKISSPAQFQIRMLRSYVKAVGDFCSEYANHWSLLTFKNLSFFCTFSRYLVSLALKDEIALLTAKLSFCICLTFDGNPPLTVNALHLRVLVPVPLN